MNKIINPAKIEGHNVFCRIKFENGNMSITGVEGPRRDGNTWGSCGQIVDNFGQYTPESEWNAEMLNKLAQIWNEYHLNYMQAACEHQRALGWTWETHPSAVCPTCGYKLGHSWLRMEVPADVIEWLESLPESKVKPAWV